MLEPTLTPHREYLLAQIPGQRLFLALKLRPQAEAAAARPQLSVAFVVDTSGSMREVVTEPTHRTGRTETVDGKTYEVVKGAKSKMEVVMASLRGILSSDLLHEGDRLALVKFDDHAEVLVPFTPAGERSRLLAAVESLSRYSGGTLMGAGMAEGLTLLEGESGSKRMMLLTDGQAFDEDVVRDTGDRLAQARVPVTAIGVGEEWNEELLTNLTDRTQGKPFYVVPDTENPQPPAVRMSDLPKEILSDLAHTAKEVVTNINLMVRTVKEVTLLRITRVFPVQNEVDKASQPYFLGSAEAGDATVFVMEFTLPARPPARMRLAQLGLSYEVPGADYRGEVAPLDVVVEFTQNESVAAQLNSEVMGWVQQRNIDGLIRQATVQAQSDPAQAQKTMELARAMTVRLGNGVMTQALDRAINELSSSKTISLGTAKTLKIGAKTQTVKVGDQEGSKLPSDEEIRRMTGA
ncbi:MAG: VWA domain-containing protein [Deinococcota bacterium]|nr:VWA domain-containing protein [Deinococcota bacterium]